MANALKCDRCGTYYTPFENIVTNPENKKVDYERSYVTGIAMRVDDSSNLRTFRIEKELDLCPCCGNALREWLGMEPLPLKVGD